MRIIAYCKFVKTQEYEGTPQMVFEDVDKGMFNRFSVTYDKGSFPSPLDSREPHWYEFRCDEYKFRSSLREFLGEHLS